MGAREPVRHLEVDRVDGIRQDGVQILPSPRDLTLEDAQRTCSRDPIRHAALIVHGPVDRERLDEPVSSESHVDQELALLAPDGQHHVRARASGPHGALAYTRLARFNREPDRQERRREQAVLFEAIPAAAPADHLRLQCLRRQPHFAAHLDLQVLERDGVHVRPVQRLERSEVGLDRREVRLDGARATDAGEIVAERERAHSCYLSARF